MARSSSQHRIHKAPPKPVEPGPGEETAENAEGAALDEALWTGRPRDFDWGD